MINLLKNWKTTSAGLIAIVGAIVSLFFVPISEGSIMAAVTGIFGGIGLLAAGDASQSVQSGDTTQITPTAPAITPTEATITKP